MSTLDTTAPTEDLPAAARPKPKSQGGGFGRYLFVRFLLIFPTIFILVTLVFFLMRTTGDPITASQGGRATPEQLDDFIESLESGGPLRRAETRDAPADEPTFTAESAFRSTEEGDEPRFETPERAPEADA